jgi:hypothetical protein
MKKCMLLQAIFVFLVITAWSTVAFLTDAHAYGKEGPLLEGISQGQLDAYRLGGFGCPSPGAGYAPAPFPASTWMIGPADSNACSYRGSKSREQAGVRRRKRGR